MNESKPEYGEPWNTGNTGSQIIRELPSGYICVASIDPLTRTWAETQSLSARIVNLINLFAGVPDESIQQLVDYSSNQFALIRAILTNPLESVPLNALVDELQNTQEFQKGVGCYRSYKQLYDMLVNSMTILKEANNKQPGTLAIVSTAKASRMVADNINRFLEPLIGSKYLKEPNSDSGQTTPDQVQ